MRSLLVAILMVLILGGPAFAGSSRAISYQGQSSGAIQGSQGWDVISSRGGIIYNITLNAANANAVLLVYDSGANSLTGPDVGYNGEVLVYEVEVASAGDSRSVDFGTAPIQTFNGITASVSNGVGFMNIEK